MNKFYQEWANNRSHSIEVDPLNKERWELLRGVVLSENGEHAIGSGKRDSASIQISSKEQADKIMATLQFAIDKGYIR